MFSKAEQLNRIEELLATWQAKTNLANARGRFDINRDAEQFICNVLNLLFDYELLVLERHDINYPAIDLGDQSKSGIAFQVTSRPDPSKLIETIKKFLNHKLNLLYPGGLKMFIISGSARYTISTKANISALMPQFNITNDILTINSLVSKIGECYDLDKNKFVRVACFIEEQLSSNGLLNPLHTKPFDINVDLPIYNSLFQKSYFDAIDKFVPIPLYQDNSPSTQADLLEWLNTGHALILGGSGDGKSKLALNTGAKFLSEKSSTIQLEAKYYKENLNSLFENQYGTEEYNTISGLIELSAKEIFKLLVIIDGFNECTDNLRSSLIKELKKLTDNHFLKLLITSQTNDPCLDILQLKVFHVRPPNLETKAAIAKVYSSKSLAPVKHLLQLVKTRMEAEIVGKISDGEIDKLSRFELFESYLKFNLGRDYLRYLPWLTQMSLTMDEKFSFSLPLNEVYDIINKNGLDEDDLHRCIKVTVLTANQNRIGFGHELKHDFFYANAVARYEDEKLIKNRLQVPRNATKKIMILGGVNSFEKIESLLDIIDSVDDLTSLVNGEAGQFAKFWAISKIDQTVVALKAELADIKYNLNINQAPHYTLSKNCIKPKTELQELCIQMLPSLIYIDKYAQDIFELIEIFDKAYVNNYYLLKDDAQKHEIGIVSNLFDAFTHDSPITEIIESFRIKIHGAGDLLSDSSLKTLLTGVNISNFGITYLVCLLFRFSKSRRAVHNILATAIGKNWNFYPYALKVALLDLIQNCWTSETERDHLIALLNRRLEETNDPMLSTHILNTLSDIGGLDDSAIEHESVVRSIIQQLLSASENQEIYAAAYSIYTCQYDHPLSQAYCNVISELEDNKLKAFIKLACQGAYGGIILSPIIIETAHILGHDSLPYLLRFTKNPFYCKNSSQESMAVFVLTHLFFAMYAGQLESDLSTENRETNQILRAWAEIVYWINRSDLTRTETERNAKKIYSTRIKPYPELAMSTLREILEGLSFRSLSYKFPTFKIFSPINVLPEIVAEVARETLNHSQSIQPVDQWNKAEDIISLAIELLGTTGNITDLALLKSYVTNKNHTSCVLTAVKLIENNG